MKTFCFLVAIALVGCTAPVSEVPVGEATIPPVGASVEATQVLATIQPETTQGPESEATESPMINTLSNHTLPTSTTIPDMDVKAGTPDLQPTTLATQSVLVERLYVSTAELSRERYLMDVSWDSSGQNLIYGVQGTRSTNNIAYLEPKNWDWWQFDLDTQESLSLPPPESAIDNETRLALGVCTQDEDSDDCDGAPRLWESPFGDWVIYHPVGLGEEAWIASKNGTNATALEGVYLPQNVSWSSDGRWAIVSGYAYRAPGMEVHYLVDIVDKSAQMLDLLTGHTLTYVNYQRPRFSPDSRYVVYAATDDPNYELEDSYSLYLLELSNLQAELLTSRFGPFQWNDEGSGLFVLDGAVVFEFSEDILAQRQAELYYIDLSNRPFEETLLFGNIDFHPHDSPSAWHWSYSPEVQAIAMVGLSSKNELGILFLLPQ